MTAQAVRPGRLLAERYRVEDLLDEVDSVRSWRGVDEVLRRDVFVHTLPTDDPRAEPFAAAARAASQVGDARFLQVLDVDAESDAVYVIREWITGQNLKLLLADGPLTPDQAAALGREVAEALANAHRQGLTHLRLEPSSVVIAPNGSVKVAGLAIEAALHGREDGDAGELDAAGVGRILYAALTGRWPDGGDKGLPAAPRIEGRVASPRQVRPGVPRLLDEVVDRTLGNGERHHASSLRSPADVANALSSGTTTAAWNNGILSDSADSGWPPPAVLDEPAPPPLLATRAAPAAQVPSETPPSQILLRAVGVVVALAFLATVAWLGARALLGDVSPDAVTAPSPPADDTSEPTEKQSPTSDPESTGNEETPAEPEPEPEPGLNLDADPRSVSPAQRITLSGSIEPEVAGVELRVERRLGDGDWVSFPDDASQIATQTRDGGAFSTWVQTSRQGENDWRLVGTVDGEQIESNVVTVTVG